MTLDPLALTAEVDRATESLLNTVAALDGDAAIAQPSLLPGWTRGHVLTHLARNADGAVNLITWARTGVVTPKYPSRQARDADIERGAGRPHAVQLADVRDSAARFAAAARDLPPAAWAALVGDVTSPRPAVLVVWHRLREVEIHHVDLAAGYTAAAWPESFARRLLHEAGPETSGVAATDGGPGPGPAGVVLQPTDGPRSYVLGGAGDDLPTIGGPAYALGAWLIGRPPGATLTVTPPGPLPTPPPWP